MLCEVCNTNAPVIECDLVAVESIITVIPVALVAERMTFRLKPDPMGELIDVSRKVRALAPLRSKTWVIRGFDLIEIRRLMEIDDVRPGLRQRPLAGKRQQEGQQQQVGTGWGN